MEMAQHCLFLGGDGYHHSFLPPVLCSIGTLLIPRTCLSDLSGLWPLKHHLPSPCPALTLHLLRSELGKEENNIFKREYCCCVLQVVSPGYLSQNQKVATFKPPQHKNTSTDQMFDPTGKTFFVK